MSTLTKTVKKEGVLTDVTGITYGVIRNDTSAVVVVAGETLDWVSTGVYQDSFDDPDDNLTYTATIIVTQGSQTVTFTDIFAGPVSSTAAAGGYTVAELATKLEDIMGWTSTTAARTTKIYQALTYAGQSAATWRGVQWWWLLDGTGSFSMVSGTNQYALRSVNGGDMADLSRVTAVYYDDDWQLKPISWKQYRAQQALGMNDTTGRPTAYTTTTKSPQIFLLPEPNTTDTINVDYTRIHNAISAGTDSSLLVPEEYQEGIYVDGAAWVLRKDVAEAASLESCPGFMEAITRMYQSSNQSYDDNPDDKCIEPGSRGGGMFPQDQKVIEYPDGYSIINTMSV